MIGKFDPTGQLKVQQNWDNLVRTVKYSLIGAATVLLSLTAFYIGSAVLR